MDSTTRIFGFATYFSDTFGDLVKPQNGAVQHTDKTLKPLSFDIDRSIFSGIKRKWTAIEGEEGLNISSSIPHKGHSPISSDNSKASSLICTLSSTKESEESSNELGLNFHLRFGNKSNPAQPAMAASKEEPICDLQLSLSVGPSRSVITSSSPVSAQASATVGTKSLIDDGATSSPRYPEGASRLLFNFIDVVDMAFVHGSMSKADRQLLLTGAELPKRLVTCSSGLTHQRISNTKICKFEGCGKGARGASGLCIAHGGGRRCHREGCNKGAEGQTVYCKAHGGGRRCHFLGCTKSAEGRTDYCIAHGGGRRCSHEGCTKAARGKSGLCIRHGGGKRCRKENCTKSAEGHSGLCISHGGGRRCQFPACSKGAQGSTMYCKAHGGGKRCTALGCTKGAEGSTPFCKGHGGGKRCSFQDGGVCTKSVHGGTRFCVAHGGGKRCAVPDCTKSARGRTNFCVRHGGGKRCMFEGCGKSAQGRTDFCKAHCGGTRCLWGQGGSNIGVGEPPCDRFARGKTGLCAAHSALLPDLRVHGGSKLDHAAAAHLHNGDHESTEGATPEKNTCFEVGMDLKKVVKEVSWKVSSAPAVLPQANLMSLPEGRVHGGSLMAMLTGAAGVDVPQAAPENPPGQGAERALPRKWM